VEEKRYSNYSALVLICLKKRTSYGNITVKTTAQRLPDLSAPQKPMLLSWLFMLVPLIGPQFQGVTAGCFLLGQANEASGLLTTPLRGL
jgi:hypothetical protein